MEAYGGGLIVLEPLRILVTNIVDYAGLFPPAALDMKTTVANWAKYAQSPESWMLGRLVVPVARLDEFEVEAAKFAPAQMSGADSDGFPEPWRISAIVGEKLDEDIERIFQFNRKHAPDFEEETDDTDEAPKAKAVEVRSVGGMVIDAIEFKASSAAQIDAAMSVIPEQLDPFIEIPTTGDVRGLIAAMAGTGARAKIRTGSMTPEGIPAAKDVAKFIFACAAAEVAFKATAGLHHPIRAEHDLSYEPACPRGVMFGFFNVFLAAAFARTLGPSANGTVGVEEIAAVLDERNAGAFAFDGAGVIWRDRRVDTARLARVRESFAISFGSCSFEEPVADLKTMGLLG